MAYHHFGSPVDITKTLKFFLKEGGTLLVTDRVGDEAQDKEDPEPFPSFKDVVAHKDSFQEKAMRQIFEDAGLGEFHFEIIPGAILDARVWGIDKQSPLFLAKGKKL